MHHIFLIHSSVEGHLGSFHSLATVAIAAISIGVQIALLFTTSVSLVRFIPRYLLVLGAIVNGIDYLISLSVFSLLVYKKATNFCTLTLYPATLLNCYMSSSSLGVESFGFSI